MVFQIGDRVMHRSFGSGEIVRVEKKELAGQEREYYVVSVNQMTLWVPVDEGDTCSIRRPVRASHFKKLFEILSTPGDPLPEDRFKRQTELSERLRAGSVEGLCALLRDISTRSATKKLNENDMSVMRKTQDLFLQEWNYVLGTPVDEARSSLDQLLAEGKAAFHPPLVS